jgi:hypothetical protein
MTQEMKNAALPPWLAERYPRAPELGERATDWDRANAKFNSLSSGEQGQYFQFINKHYREMLDENDLATNSQKFDLLVRNKDSSEQYRLDFERRIAADSTLSRLLAKMQSQVG